MVEVLVLAMVIGNTQINYYFFNNWIFKEYIYETEELAKIADKSFELYSIEENLVYIVPFTMEYKDVLGKPNSSNWSSTSKKSINISLEKIEYLDFNCIKQTETFYSETPLGDHVFQTETYFADLSEYLKDYMQTDILKFLGVSNFENHPYLIRIRMQNVFNEGIPYPYLTTTVDYKMVDSTLLQSLLMLPLRN